jgi:malate dehydrogenase
VARAHPCRLHSGIAGAKPSETIVPCVGGHSGPTIVPLLSQAAQGSAVKAGEAYEKLVHRIQYGGDEVVKAKDGAGSATLSMAYAAAVFSNSLMRAIGGESNVVECTYVDSPLYKDQGVDFFSSKVTLSGEGVGEIHPVGKLSAEEEKVRARCARAVRLKLTCSRTLAAHGGLPARAQEEHPEGCPVVR